MGANGQHTGEVAVVTGAARGMGLEIARRLVDRGYTVMMTDVVDEAVRSAATGLGHAAHARALDVRDPSAHAAAARAAAELGRLTIWVNNAGVLRAAKAWEHPDGEVSLMVQTNLLGVMYGSQAAVEVMRGSGGRILNVASMSALGPVPGLAVYAATKAGVLGFTTSLQGDLDLAGIPIRVHALCPHAANTRLVHDVTGEEDAALLFSAGSLLRSVSAAGKARGGPGTGGLLDPGTVADRAVAMLEGRRIQRSIPGHSAALMRAGALVPTVGLEALGFLRRIGERRRVAAARGIREAQRAAGKAKSNG